MDRIQAEVTKAQAQYAPFRTLATALGILAEEIEEYWRLVCEKQDAHRYTLMIEELTQVGAMARRTALDLGVWDAFERCQMRLAAPLVDSPHGVWWELRRAMARLERIAVDADAAVVSLAMIDLIAQEGIVLCEARS